MIEHDRLFYDKMYNTVISGSLYISLWLVVIIDKNHTLFCVFIGTVVDPLASATRAPDIL